jgi:hypothetical protein
MRIAVGSLLLAFIVCTPAQAQERHADSVDPAVAAQPRSPRPPPRVPFDFRAYAHLDEVWMTASQSFDAVLGTSSLTAGGVGVDIVDLWRGAFVRAGISRMGGHGSRVFVVDEDVIASNVAVAVRFRTIELGAGWRYSLPKRQAYTVYGGVDLLRVRYTEVSDFATDEENAPESFWGTAIFGGLEVQVWKRMVAGGEVQFRSVPDAIGAAGVSADFNETNLGGFVIRGLIGFRK